MRYLFGERLYKETLLARPKIRSTDILTFIIPLGYINSSTLSWREKLYENTYDITIETSLDNGETWRPQLPGEQIPGLAEISITEPTKLLVRAIVDTTNTINPADITNITLDIDYSSIGHYAICSDGRAYFNGQEIGGKPDFIDFSDGTLKIKGGRKVDELYVTPRLLTKEEIDILHQTQYELQDPKESIDAGFRKISHLSGEIDADGHTIYASIQGQNKIVAHYGIDPETGDRGLFVYDIDEQGNPVEIGFTGRRGDGTVVGFGGGGFTPGSDIVTGNITPATDNLSIGTPDNRFYAIYADTLGGIPVEEFINSRIVEQGSNENGEYIRWENGLQMCWVDGVASFTKEGSLAGYDYSDNQYWTFPVKFIAMPFVNLEYRGSVGYEIVLMNDISLTRARFRVTTLVGHMSDGSRSFNGIAIGRWK